MFTYDLSTDIGKIRLAIQDKNEDSFVFHDEEIEAILAMNSNSKIKTMIQLYYAWASKIAQSSVDSLKVDDITIQNGKKSADFYINLAKQLIKSVEDGYYIDYTINPIYVGGMFQADIDENISSQNDGTIVKNPFDNNMFNTFNNNLYDNG